MKKPIPQIGGKYFSMTQLLRLIPYHNTYVEVFGGGASLLFAKEPSFKEIYNDIDDMFYNFFKVLRDKPQELFLFIKRTPIANKLWDEYKCEISGDKIRYNEKMRRLNDVAKAGIFYIIKRWSYGNKLESSFLGGRGKNKAKPSGYDIVRFAYRLRKVYIENRDFEYIINRYDNDTTFFYCDPPYYISDVFYKYKWKEEEHLRLYNCLKEIRGKFLLSYNDCKFIKDLYKDFKILDIPVYSGLGNKEVYELAILNY